MLGGDRTDRLDIEDVIGRVTDDFGVKRLRLRRDRPGELLGLVRIDEGGIDPHLAEGIVELREGTAI